MRDSDYGCVPNGCDHCKAYQPKRLFWSLESYFISAHKCLQYVRWKSVKSESPNRADDAILRSEIEIAKSSLVVPTKLFRGPTRKYSLARP